MAAVREKIKIEAEVLRDPAVPEESVATSQSAPLVISLKHFEEAARTVRPSWEADGKGTKRCRRCHSLNVTHSYSLHHAMTLTLYALSCSNGGSD